MINDYFKIIAVVIAVVSAGLYLYERQVEITKSTRAFEEALKIKATAESLEEGHSTLEIYLPEGCSLTVTKNSITVSTPLKTKSIPVSLKEQNKLKLNSGSHRLKITSSKVEKLR